MRNHEALEDADFRLAEALSRATPIGCHGREGMVRAARPGAVADPGRRGGLDNVMLQAMRPFLTRAADAIMARIDFAGWQTGALPALRGRTGSRGDHAGRRADPDLRPLHRPLAVPPADLPVLPEPGSQPITSFASRDGRYRLYGATCASAISRRTTPVRRRARSAGGRWSGDAAAGCGSDAEGLQVERPARLGLLRVFREDVDAFRTAS